MWTNKTWLRCASVSFGKIGGAALCKALKPAAVDGRVADIEALLSQGVPIDAADADGTTALMQSIQADQPAAAALLRQRGASLDQKNLAGLTARDMAKAKDDPELDQALGLER